MRHTHLGVYGVVEQNQRILLVKKARGPYIGLFDLPGGGIEFGETPEQALMREVGEGTGQKIALNNLLFCESIRLQHDTTSDKSMEDLHHIGIVYSVSIIENSAIKTSSDGFDSNGAFWYNPETGDMEKLTPFAKKAVFALLQKMGIGALPNLV